MKKTIYLLAFLLGALPFWSSCEKELMDYEGQDGLFFDVQWASADWGDTTVWAHQIYSVVAFGSMEETSADVKLKIAVAGSVKDYDRPFKVEVVEDSTTALMPEEFEFTSGDCVIKAGTNHTFFRFKAHKTERMDGGGVQVQFRIVPGEHFTLPFSLIGNIPGRWDDTETDYSRNADPGIHNVFITNVLVHPGRGWNEVQLGKWTAKKYGLLLEVTGRELGYGKAEFEDADKMQTGRCVLVARVGSAYLMEQYRKGREYWVLDEDGTMMWINGVSWSQGTRPEDMENI